MIRFQAFGMMPGRINGEETFAMIVNNIENILALFATIVGLLACLFMYIRSPRKSYLYLISFFICSFLSDYYWTIYSLVTYSYPEVSEILAYLGWTVGYFLLSVVIFQISPKASRRYFHPVILWPVLTNVPQFILYIQFGGILNNVLQVGTTTLAMILCMQQIMYYLKERKNGAKVPYLSYLILAYLVFEYGMWTSSCFDRISDALNPYLYCSILAAFCAISFAWGAGKQCQNGEEDPARTGWSDFRFQTVVQAIAAVVVCGASLGGFAIASQIKKSMEKRGTASYENIALVLFAISVLLVLFVILLMVFINLRYKATRSRKREEDSGRHSRFNFITIIAITLIMMVFIVTYNTSNLYNASVTNVYEDGEDVAFATSTELENYLTTAKTTLRVAADSIDQMVRNGSGSGEILDYIMEQTQRSAEEFDENFTGIYAYLNGQYLDGLGWVPPEDYDPISRDWYKYAVEAGGKVVIVSPYLDAQTGSVVITVVKEIHAGSDPSLHNVVALDVIVNHIQDVTERVDVAGKGYGMVVNSDGFIVAHEDASQNGKNVKDVYGEAFLDQVVHAGEESVEAVLDEEEYTLFVRPVMDQWYLVIAVGNAELMEGVNSQITVTIMISLAIFLVITFFYYFGYKIEQHNSNKIEEMNMQVVSALAEAVDAKDTYTNGHSSRVAKYAEMIAERVGYSESQKKEIYMMGLLHDVGKIGIPDDVINKPGKLTEEELEIIRKHPIIGSRILESIKERPSLAVGARSHHERYAGGGYPDGLSGENIPEAARIIAVADAYDAMTSRRSYRDVLPREKVIEEIRNGSGTQFDPRFADAMLQLIDEDKNYLLRENGTPAPQDV